MSDPENPPARVTGGRSPVTDDAILSELRRVATLDGGTPLSVAFYDAHHADDAPTASRIIQRLGSWSAACARAGVSSRAPSRRYTTAWDEDALLAWVRRFLADDDTGTSYADLAAWLKERTGEGAPSAQTIRNKLGAWADVKRRASDDRAG